MDNKPTKKDAREFADKYRNYTNERSRKAPAPSKPISRPPKKEDNK